MHTIAVSKLRANLMRVLQEIELGSTIAITCRGVVVAKLIPPDDSRQKASERLLQIGAMALIGDLISPVDARWEVLD